MAGKVMRRLRAGRCARLCFCGHGSIVFGRRDRETAGRIAPPLSRQDGGKSPAPLGTFAELTHAVAEPAESAKTASDLFNNR